MDIYTRKNLYGIGGTFFAILSGHKLFFLRYIVPTFKNFRENSNGAFEDAQETLDSVLQEKVSAENLNEKLAEAEKYMTEVFDKKDHYSKQELTAIQQQLTESSENSIIYANRMQTTYVGVESMAFVLFSVLAIRFLNKYFALKDYLKAKKA